MTNGKLGYCKTCGDSLWEGVEHACGDDDLKIPRKGMNPLVAQMLYTLVLVDIELSGEGKNWGEFEAGRVQAAVRRIIRKFGVTDDDRLFAVIQTTAEACPPASWNDIA